MTYLFIRAKKYSSHQFRKEMFIMESTHIILNFNSNFIDRLNAILAYNPNVKFNSISDYANLVFKIIITSDPQKEIVLPNPLTKLSDELENYLYETDDADDINHTTKLNIIFNDPELDDRISNFPQEYYNTMGHLNHTRIWTLSNIINLCISNGIKSNSDTKIIFDETTRNTLGCISHWQMLYRFATTGE